MNFRSIAQLLSTPSLVVALAFGAQACCGGLTYEEADKTLRVSIDEAPAEAVEGAEQAPVDAPAPATKLCGATVVARDDDGAEIALEEIETERGCEYVAEGVDPFTTYTIVATHPELGEGADPFGDSNPACSVPTASEDIDNTVLIARAPAQLDRNILPRKG